MAHAFDEPLFNNVNFMVEAGEKIAINKDYINKNLDNLVKDTDLSKFIL